MATRLERLHEDDYFVWTHDQAQALRRLARIIEHALKLEHSSSSDPRHGWHATIADARRFRTTLVRPVGGDVFIEMKRDVYGTR